MAGWAQAGYAGPVEGALFRFRWLRLHVKQGALVFIHPAFCFLLPHFPQAAGSVSIPYALGGGQKTSAPLAPSGRNGEYLIAHRAQAARMAAAIRPAEATGQVAQ